MHVALSFEGSQRPSLVDHLRILMRYQELLVSLSMRDVKVRYKQSLFGIVWAVLQPFMLMVVFSIVFSLFVKVKTPGMPYAVFSYVALVPWTYFSRGLTNGVMSLIANSVLVTKIYFPRELFPLAALVSGFIDFAVSAVIFVGMLVFFHIGVGFALLWTPLIVLVQMALMLGLMLLLSAANVFYRDVYQTTPFLLQLWLYITPVIYPLSLVPARFHLLFALNPMTGLVDAYRRVILQNRAPDPRLFTYAAVVSLVLLVLGYAFFKKVELQFADVI